jgi:multisubunit Na+/H+ antiporter MnhB subunit
MQALTVALLTLILFMVFYGWPRKKRLTFLNSSLKISAATTCVIGFLTVLVLDLIERWKQVRLSNRVEAIPYLILDVAMMLLVLARRDENSPKETMRIVTGWALVGAGVLVFMWWNPQADWFPLHWNPAHFLPGLPHPLQIAGGILFYGIVAFFAFAWVRACLANDRE